MSTVLLCLLSLWIGACVGAGLMFALLMTEVPRTQKPPIRLTPHASRLTLATQRGAAHPPPDPLRKVTRLARDEANWVKYLDD